MDDDYNETTIIEPEPEEMERRTKKKKNFKDGTKKIRKIEVDPSMMIPIISSCTGTSTSIPSASASTSTSTNIPSFKSSATKKNKSQIMKEIWNTFEKDKYLIKLEDICETINNDEMGQLYKTKHFCEKCNSVLNIIEDVFPTCLNPECGIVIKDVVDYSPEWRFYGAGDNKNITDPTRCGNPINPLLMESSFGCKILCNRYSSFEMKKIKKWTEWTAAPHREKSLYEEFQFITTMAQNSGIPKMFIDYAMIVHKDISEQKMFRGLNRDGIKAASIYISCRMNGFPRTPHEIAEIFKLDKQSASVGCSKAVNILNNIERNMMNAQKTEFKNTTSSLFIERYCSRLNVPNELTLFAKFIANKTENMDILCDNTPQSCTAGILYFISQTFNLGITKANIKSICGVSEVTIGKCYKKLESIKEQLIPQCIVKKYSL